MPINSDSIINAVPSFVENVLGDLQKRNLHMGDRFIDHVCFRVSNFEYEFYKKEFLLKGELLSEANISGRPICTFKLFCPIPVGNRIIPCIEIPAPKSEWHYPTGLEHLEFVIEETFEKFASRYPDLLWDWRGSRKKHNPELALTLDEGRSAKFHHQALEEVIRLEKLGLLSTDCV